METVKHLWNVKQFATKLASPLVTDLQIFYMQKCKNLGNSVELPQQNFGPATMCSHCGSLWSNVDHQARILSGKRMSKSVKKIARCMNENLHQKIPRARTTLLKKSIKNEMNKLVIKCSICSKNTELPFKKKTRLKSIKLNQESSSQTETPKHYHKKKKKKSKDKTAGLNVSGYTPTSQLNKKANSKTPTTSPVIMPQIISSNKKSISPKKSKKLNIRLLKRVMENKTTTPAKRKNLHNFLTELY